MFIYTIPFLCCKFEGCNIMMRFKISFKHAHMAVGIECLEMYQYLGAFDFYSHLEFSTTSGIIIVKHLKTLKNCSLNQKTQLKPTFCETSNG